MAHDSACPLSMSAARALALATVVMVCKGKRVQILVPDARAVRRARAQLTLAMCKADGEDNDDVDADTRAAWDELVALDAWRECTHTHMARVYLTAGALSQESLATCIWPAVKRAADVRAYTLAHVHTDGTLEVVTQSAARATLPSSKSRSTLSLMR